MINNKNINLNFLLDWRMWALIIIGTYSLFSVSKLNKSMTHIICNSSSCQVKDYNSRGTLEHFSEFPISQCKSFGIEEQSQTFLNLIDRISYRESSRYGYHRYKVSILNIQLPVQMKTDILILYSKLQSIIGKKHKTLQIL